MSIGSRTCLVAALMLLAVQLQAAPNGTGFTYQGVLSDGGSPASGAYDFRFLLYDVDFGGSQVGGTVLVDDLMVTDGRMTTTLDFGAVYDGTALWLEIHVRDGASTGAYSVLSPRQDLTPGPYAHHSVTAESATSAGTAGYATSAGDAAQLGGQNPSYYLSWANLTGIPGGLDDGDDDTLAGLACATGEIAKLNEFGAWICAPDAGARTATYLVGPVGTSLENGTALLAAVAALPAGVRSRLDIEPGIYDLGDQSLQVPSSTYIHGSGPSATSILSTVCSSATIDLDSYSDLHGVYVKNECAAGTSYGIRADFGNTLSDVYIHVIGGGAQKHGVWGSTGDFVIRHSTIEVECTSSICKGLSATESARIDDVKILVSGGVDHTQGLYGGLTLDLTDVVVEVTAGGAETYGIYNQAFVSTRLSGVRVSAAAATGTANGIRLSAGNSDPVVITDVTSIASTGGGGSTCGLYLDRGNLTIDGVTLEGNVAIYYDTASAGGLNITNSTLIAGHTAIHVYNIYGAIPVTVENSLLTGPIYVIWMQGTPGPITVAGSKLAGGSLIGASSLTCAGVWDENATFYPSTCP